MLPVFLPASLPWAGKRFEEVSLACTDWVLPERAGDLVGAILWACGGPVTARLEASRYVTAEFLRDADTGKLVIHIVNFHPEADAVGAWLAVGDSAVTGLRARLPDVVAEDAFGGKGGANDRPGRWEQIGLDLP